MSTVALPKKRSLNEIDATCDLQPSAKKIKTSMTEECHETTNGSSSSSCSKEQTKNSSCWAIDPEKKAQDFRNYQDSRRQETVENFYKELRTKMTFECTMEKRAEHLQFNKCVMTVWEMIHYLDQVVDESDPDTNLTQIQHAIQTGEAARKLYPGPEYDWFHITGLIHDLGKVLAVNDKSKGLTGEPQWCVVGDTYPVGCQFNETNLFYEYYENNPDSKNKTYNSFYGIYEPKCGLSNVYMSWGHDEYMYQIAKTQSKLPEEALYMLRFHSFYPWHNKHGYMHLCNDRDLELLKWVKAFQKCDLYSKSHECPTLADVASYYKPILEKYFPEPVRW